MLSNIRHDFQASIVTFLVALPLCLGIALASQAPLASGLIAGIIGGIVVGLVSGSHLSVSGPSAGLAVIVASSVQELGDFQIFTAALLLSGILQLLFAALRAGRLGSYFPTSVIKGMLSSIGLILVLKQIPHAIGFDVSYMGSEGFVQQEGGNTFSTIITALGALRLGSAAIAVLSFAIILGWDRLSFSKNNWARLFPSALLAVISSLFVSEFLLKGTALEIEREHLVQLPFVDGWRSLFSSLALPSEEAFGRVDVYVAAATIAIVGSLESLLSLDAADKIDPEKRFAPKNRELLAQGAGNILSGLVGGLPITSVIVRTSANVSAGAKSKASAIMHGVWLLLAVLLIPGLLNRIPLATLAAVLILVGWKLTKPELYVEMYRKGPERFIPFIVTIGAILVTDLLKGICIGLLVGFFFVIRRSNHQAVVMVNVDKDYLIRFMKDNAFPQKDQLMRLLRQIPDGSNVVIDGSKDVFIDADIIDLIEDFIEGSKARRIGIELKKSTTALSPLFRTA